MIATEKLAAVAEWLEAGGARSIYRHVDGRVTGRIHKGAFKDAVTVRAGSLEDLAGMVGACPVCRRSICGCDENKHDPEMRA